MHSPEYHVLTLQYLDILPDNLIKLAFFEVCDVLGTPLPCGLHGNVLVAVKVDASVGISKQLSGGRGGRGREGERERERGREGEGREGEGEGERERGRGERGRGERGRGERDKVSRERKIIHYQSDQALLDSSQNLKPVFYYLLH